MADQSQIDPRLFASASSVQPSRPQIYTSAQQQNTGHPYYLPSRPSTRQSPANQTPLHLLSEVAMGSSNNAASQQQQTQAHSRSQQQAQAALQAHAQHSQQAMPNWYPNINAQPTAEMMGLGAQQPFDINFDFTQFDLGTGSDADLSALFIPDSMAMWSYPTDPNMQGYNGF